MQCPNCGYSMTALDDECLRCKQLGARPSVAVITTAAVEEKECPRCGKAAGISVPACDKCGYVYGSERVREELAAALPAAPPPLELFTVEPQSALQKTVPPVLSWSILLATMAGAGILAWYMIGGADNYNAVDDADTASASPTFHFRHHRHHKLLPAKASHMVAYQVTGTAASVNIAYFDASGATQKLMGIALPWSQTFQAATGASLHVTAQAVSGTGTVAAEIDVDNTPRKQIAASAATADASDTL